MQPCKQAEFTRAHRPEERYQAIRRMSFAGAQVLKLCRKAAKLDLPGLARKAKVAL
jgi:hypothetical protein